MLKQKKFFFPTEEEFEKFGFSVLDAQDAEVKEKEDRERADLGLRYLAKYLSKKKATRGGKK